MLEVGEKVKGKKKRPEKKAEKNRPEAWAQQAMLDEKRKKDDKETPKKCRDLIKTVRTLTNDHQSSSLCTWCWPVMLPSSRCHGLLATTVCAPRCASSGNLRSTDRHLIHHQPTVYHLTIYHLTNSGGPWVGAEPGLEGVH